MSHRDDDLGPALRAMLSDHHLDVRTRSDAVGTVLAGVGRARRRRTTGYAAASTLAIAAAIGAVTLTGGDAPQGIQPAVTPSASATRTVTEPPAATVTPSPSITPPPTTAAPTTPPPTTSTPPTEPVQPVIEMLRPDGIGDVVLGSPLAAAYGTGTLEMYDPATGTGTAWDGSGAEDVCTIAGQAKRSTPDGALVWLDDANGVTEIAIWPSTSNSDVQTVEGLRLSDDLDRVLELYPDARHESAPSSEFYFVDDWGGEGNVLKIRDDLTGTVQGMSLVLPGHGGCYE